MCYNCAMSVSIKPYSEVLAHHFADEKERLRNILGADVLIEHVGSSAVGIGGKNIIDILVGVKDTNEMSRVRDILAKNGYFEGNDSHVDRIFMASSEGETGEGDFHIHICPVGSETYANFIVLRDFLRTHPEKAQEYFVKKEEFAKLVGFDRKKYKALKSEYVDELIREARASLVKID